MCIKSIILTCSLAQLRGCVGGLQRGLEARAGQDEAAHTARRLWVASSSLSAAVAAGDEAEMTPLAPALAAVRSAAGAEDTFVRTVAASIPSLALERGVYTDLGLRRRFEKVERVARRVAWVGDTGGSLAVFGLSWLRSLLVVNLATAEAADPASAPSHELLGLARSSLERGDLARAVQLVTAVRGAAGRVAADWLAEARLSLETQQAASAILAHSLAAGCQNITGK